MAELALNALSRADATAALTRCCGAGRWVDGMLERWPFASRAALFSAAEEVWAQLAPGDYLDAFAQHPQIGANLAELRQKFASTAAWASSEQSSAMGASEATLLALKDGNAAYRARFGYTFIVCASGKSAEHMLALLRTRLDHSPEAELAIAAAEQAKITHLRLEKLDA